MKLNRNKVAGLLIIGTIILLVAALAVYSSGFKVVSKPKVQWVSHTEYWEDDYASTIVRISDYKGTPFNIDSCRVNILNPDKTLLIGDAPMTQSGITGNWYRTDSLVGNPPGTYEQEVICVYNGNQEIRTAQSFHLNPALNYLKTMNANIIATGASLTGLNVDIQGRIANSTQIITAQVIASETDLNTVINNVKTALMDEMVAHNASTGAQLTDIELSLSAQIGATGNAITTQLNDVNATVVSLLNTVRSDIVNLMTPYLQSINQTSAQVYADTQWLVLNAMNQADKAEIDVRFTNIDNNLAVIQQFCGNTQTQTSDLCQEIDGLIITVDTLRSEQTTYFNTVDATTTSTWDLLSGSIVENINLMLADLNILKGTTADINATVKAIREDQISQVQVVVIS